MQLQSLKQNKTVLTFTDIYLPYMLDEAMMAVCFGYIHPLFEQIMEMSLKSEYDTIYKLYNSEPLSITLNRGNLTISN